jgi:predicted  nucleic acid-binding Zn-ribbon protein
MVYLNMADFLSENKNASKQEIFSHFFNELDMQNQLLYIKTEVEKTKELSEKIRPVMLRKKDLEEKLKEISQEMEIEVASAYPPRQGSEREREILRSKLKKESQTYQNLDAEYRAVSELIFNLEIELQEVQTKAKNARRISETFETILNYVSK